MMVVHNGASSLLRCLGFPSSESSIRSIFYLKHLQQYHSLTEMGGLPFTIDQFLQVFADYNMTIWPTQLLAYVLGMAALLVDGIA